MVDFATDIAIFAMYAASFPAVDLFANLER
jgi:hypothetical protein